MARTFSAQNGDKRAEKVNAHTHKNIRNIAAAE